MSRFPKITETFVLYEMLAIEKQGIEVEVYPLQRERTAVMHPEAVSYVQRAHFQPFISWPIVRAQLHFLRRKPGIYFHTLWKLLRGTWGSLRYFSGAVVFFPKAVYFAYQMAGDRIEHVHAHFASHPTSVAFVIHSLLGIPYSFTAHGSDIHRDRHMLREKVAHAGFVVAISKFNREVILKECGGENCDKIIVIHCGVDIGCFQPQRAAQDHQVDAPFTILCIGTLHEVKGQTYLVEACRSLHQRGLDFELHFVGDGPDLPALQSQVASAQIKDRVVFHGRKQRADVIELLERAHVVVAPSVPTKDGRREGIPVVLIEAMSCGLPVVASDISGIPELVEQDASGFLVPPRDVQSLADALQRLHRDPALCRRLGQEGRKTIEAEFHVHSNAALLAQHFLDIRGATERKEETMGRSRKSETTSSRVESCS